MLKIGLEITRNAKYSFCQQKNKITTFIRSRDEGLINKLTLDILDHQKLIESKTIIYFVC